MATGSTARLPNELWGARLRENLRRAAASKASQLGLGLGTPSQSTPAAGLADEAGPRRRLNLSFGDIEAPDAGLDFTQRPQPAPGPRVVPPPGAKIKAKDVRREFDNLTFWDRMMKTPEWQRGVEGVGEIREAEATRAAKPDRMQEIARRAEADAQALDAEADRLRKAGKISEARAKSEAAYAKRQEAMETSWAEAKVNEVDEAKKKASDWIKNAKKKKAEAFDAKKKAVVRGGGAAAVGLGLGYVGNEAMKAWQESKDASAENIAANEIMNRILMGGATTPEEDALVVEKLGSEDALLRLKEQGGAAPVAPLDPGQTFGSPLRSGPGIMPPTSISAPAVTAPTAPVIDVDYRPGAEKPEVPDTESTYDPAVHAAILADPEGGPEVAAEYADFTAAEDHRRRANALTDAGIENTAAAAEAPDWLLDYLREQGEVARAADRGEMPVSDNWWNRNIAVPMAESLARAEEFNANPANREGSPVLQAYDSLPDWARSTIDVADQLFNPITIGRNLMATTTDEARAMPYQVVRNTLLGPGAFTGWNDEAFGPVYAEALRGMGGEPLTGDPVMAPITQGAAPLYGPADLSDMPLGDMGSGTGALNAGMPSMEELAALERIGALGVNPDGSNMTVAQYIQQGNLAGLGMEPALPMFGGAPDMGGMPPLRRLPPPDLGGLPPLPSDPRLSLPAGGMPAAAALPPGPPLRVNQPAVAPGGPGDQYAGGGLFGPAMAGTVQDEERQAVDAVVDDLIEQDETLHPKGQTDERPSAAPQEKSWWDWLTYGGDEEPAAAQPVTAEPVLADGGLDPNLGGGFSMGRPAAPSTGGAVGDLNSTRAVIEERGVAGLADDAEAAEEELNWINRMMRDKLGMTDASERAKAAEALISFGSTVLASRGDDWQAIGEGIQAGYGTVSQINDEEAAALAAQQEAILEENRWRQEMALKELAASRGGGASVDVPDKIEQIQYLMAMAKIADPNITEAEAYQQALERVYSSDGLAALLAMSGQ